MQEQERATTTNVTKRPTQFLSPRLSHKFDITHRHQLSCQQEAQELSEIHPHLPTEIEQIGGLRCSTSKNTPAIAAARSLHFCPYLDSMLYRGSSAATLQHSSIFWSFSKEKREENLKHLNSNLWKD